MPITIPKYGETVTDAAGRTGVAKFDPNTGAPLANPAATPTIPTVRTPGLLEEAKKKAIMTEETTNSIKQQADQYAASQRQARIDAINTTFAPRIQREKEAGEARLKRVSALNFNAGIVGSGVDTTKTGKQNDLNEEAIRAIEAEKSTLINDAFNIADELGSRRAEQLTKEKQGAAEGNVAFYQDMYDKATEALKMFGSADVTIEDLKRSDPNTYQTLKDVAGLSDFDIATRLDLAKPKPDMKLSYENGVVIAYGIDPKSGKPVTYSQKVDGIPADYKPTFAPDGTLLFLPEKFDPSKPFNEQVISGGKYAKPEKPTESDVIPGENPQLYSGLSTKTATAVRSKAGAFKSEPIVQNFAVVQEGKNFASSLSDTTTNPADDQALVYALAKALDPGSVVREGEYATAQKYAQSWVKAYGKGVEQALFGTGFLSLDARKNIKKTIDQKFTASQSSYNNLYKQYATGINNLTGRKDGDKFISDYSITDTAGGGDDPQVAELRAAGYTDAQIQALLNQ